MNLRSEDMETLGLMVVLVIIVIGSIL